MTIETRLSRLEGSSEPVEARIAYAATERDAERVYVAAVEAGSPPPLIIVTTPDQSPSVIIGETITSMMRDVAENGSQIQDEEGRYRWSASNPGWIVWKPAGNSVRA